MNTPLALEIVGLQVPDAGPVFLAALAVHVAAGATAVGAGLTAATSRKRAGRHPRAGTVYLGAIGTVFATAAVMAGLRWRHDRHLFVIATVAFGLALLGWWARRHRPRRWITWHGSAMSGSYAALVTGFYVDNGPQLPLWDSLPHLTYWLLPAASATPLTLRALARVDSPATSRGPVSASVQLIGSGGSGSNRLVCLEKRAMVAEKEYNETATPT